MTSKKLPNLRLRKDMVQSMDSFYHETKSLISNKLSFVIFLVSLIVFFFVIVPFLVSVVTSKTEFSKIEISELSDGVYVYYRDAVSAIPAQNYTMITFRDTTGNIFTYHGNSIIHDYSDGTPYVEITERMAHNCDTVVIYAPADSVVYQGAVVIY